MTLTIAGTSFDQHEYDGRGDLSVRFILDREDAITVTLPPDHVVSAKIQPALIAA